jgi:hypothetical protein
VLWLASRAWTTPLHGIVVVNYFVAAVGKVVFLRIRMKSKRDGVDHDKEIDWIWTDLAIEKNSQQLCIMINDAYIITIVIN